MYGGGTMKLKLANKDQLELGFTPNILRITVRPRRAARAAWWFDQMRKAVDSTIDWRPASPGHPNQMSLVNRRSMPA